METKPASSTFLKNINDKKLSNDSLWKRDDNKEHVTGSIYALFILL